MTAPNPPRIPDVLVDDEPFGKSLGPSSRAIRLRDGSVGRPKIVAAARDRLEADRVAAGYRLAVIPEAHLLGIVSNAVGHSIAADRDTGSGVTLTDEETKLASRVTLRVVGDLFELMGRGRPDRIG